MGDKELFLPLNLQDLRDCDLEYDDKVEFGTKGIALFSRWLKHKGRFQGWTWRPVEVKQYRRWWERFAKKPVRCEVGHRDFDPFELLDHLKGTLGLRIMVISGVKIQVFSQEYEIPWKNLRFLRKVG